MLRLLFTAFDRRCLCNNIFKIYTIGDCYVAIGLIDSNNRNIYKEALNVVKMAFDMIEEIKDAKE